ncbi:MAG: DEAD/DEAH box helicase [Xenococcaceae cyanobacterium MO_234.B1]|nr:DEAD/DEAH box helicase [Xenococcaceae cyanobacterium MO_234.B1]
MKENWVKIEDLFREKGIDFKRQDWLYFCLIEGRYFYYSPQTGKWRIKGKGLWLCSTSPENFIAMAKVYVVPEAKPHSTKFNQQKTRSLANRKTKPTSTQENTKSNDARSRGLTQQQNRSSSQIGKPKIKTQTIEVPLSIAKEVQLFVNLLLAGEIDSLSDLFKKAGLSWNYNLEALWKKVIVKLVVNEDRSEPTEPATPMLLRRMTPEVEKSANVAKPSKRKENYQLTPDQKKALSRLKQFTRSNNKFFRLTGYAGTGKSFLITHYMRWLIDESINFVAATPTNKAAKSLSSLALNEDLNIEVKTVAQLLGQQPQLDENTGKELFITKGKLDWSGYGVIIIDEFSMVNRSDFQDIVDEIQSNLLSKVVFVGDSAQLPPVGEKEPIVSICPLIRQSSSLTKVVRYDGELAQVAEAIRSNPKYSRTIFPFTTTGDRTILCLPEAEWLNKAISLFESPEFKENPDQIRFLAWRNKTVESLNNFVRSQLWGEDAPLYVPGDRLIARRPLFRPKPGAKGKNKWGIIINNSEEAQVRKTGELCQLSFRSQIYQYWKVEVQPDMGKPLTLSILHADSKELHQEQVQYFISTKQWSHYYDLSRMFDDVAYAYALTTHKAQGSTINYVFLDIKDMRGCSERQKLLYTALTRARTQVLIPQ